MLRRDDDERHAVNRIGTSRVDRQLLSQGGHVKAEFQPFGTANPVFLHDLDPIRPAGDFLHVLQEFIGIFRNLEEPLAQALLVDFVMAAPAFSVFDLFVGQDRVAMVAPVDGRFLLTARPRL